MLRRLWSSCRAVAAAPPRLPQRRRRRCRPSAPCGAVNRHLPAVPSPSRRHARRNAASAVATPVDCSLVGYVFTYFFCQRWLCLSRCIIASSGSFELLILLVLSRLVPVSVQCALCPVSPRADGGAEAEPRADGGAAPRASIMSLLMCPQVPRPKRLCSLSCSVPVGPTSAAPNARTCALCLVWWGGVAEVRVRLSRVCPCQRPSPLPSPVCPRSARK